MEKVVEELIRSKNNHLSSHNIIIENHHWSREAHSTLTEVQSMENAAKKNNVQNRHTVILATDLSSAYDIVAHPTILQKMEHIGIRGNPCGQNVVL